MSSSMPQPCPVDWGRAIDLMPMITLQEMLKPMPEIGHVKLTVSTQDRDPSVLKTELGATVRDIASIGHAREYSFGNPNPSVVPESTRSFKEIIEDANSIGIVKEVQGFPDMVMKNLTTLEPIPERLLEVESLGGLDYMYRQQVSRGNFNKKFHRSTGLVLCDPHFIVSQGLLANCGFKPTPELAKCLRSIMETTYVIGVDGNKTRGYGEMGKESVERFQRSLVDNLWWRDFATLRQCPSTICGIHHIHHLVKRNSNIIF